jgi:phosphonate degradation associated HDIG domain protein
MKTNAAKGVNLSVTIAGEVFQLLELRGHTAYFGEQVSQLEHALQAARLAEEAGSRPALIAAALLHDVGHVLPDLPEDIAEQGVDARHEILGHAWLLARFGPEVAEPVRLHVSAKRYLCRVDPNYLAQLSPSSALSLKLQGGPFTDEGVREFESNPHFREAVLLRRWDDAAKIPGLPVPALEHYRGVLAAAAEQALSWAASPPFETGQGMWAKYGPAPSDEESDENRREMFRNFA